VKHRSAAYKAFARITHRLPGRETGPSARCAAAAVALLGSRFEEAPLGDREKPGTVRFDAFDCQTFVETVLALGLGPDFAAFRRVFVNLRFGLGARAVPLSPICPNWLENAQAAGVLRKPVIVPDAAEPGLVPLRSLFCSTRKHAGPRARPYGGLFLNRDILDALAPLSLIILSSTRGEHMGICVLRDNGLVFVHADWIRGRVNEIDLIGFLITYYRFSVFHSITVMQLAA
jgi:Protein of unknown function (DUF1460)